MAKGCPECEALERELVRLQTLRLSEVKESDVFKVMYAKFSEVIPEVQKVSWRRGAEAMRQKIAVLANSYDHLLGNDIAEFILAVPMVEEEDADLQLQMRARVRRKKDLDA